ncbi:MAG TPA: M23 family metallopeptidase [Spirochaetota bacterium]|nr:M23 family metallopeptidase [Spirochaetota bacterium]HPC39803.1 M23 family metallopeptidase [Spirochaetota bacterium]HPL16331.1 M23 family metallopeptidase [Spirochaetota bacterium]HQF09850.1 M23 family metallopeptidase [Spirochaetota bacterium]HQH98500.1 M23 family metallopeptidase [Spirochaetota bacterium]
MNLIRTISIVIVVMIGAAAGTAADPAFLWPIDRPAMITGTFGEYRGPHFHHGIDVSTGGKTGYAVFAADDGYVSSVMYQQWGIGYAVIITHGNGWSTLYGHMERFDDAILNNQKIKGYASRIENRKDFRVDLGRSVIPVKKGAVIGYSGESGIGLEHFHFEVRREDGEPVNPLTSGIIVDDTNPPVITAVSLVPLNGHSRVDGSSRATRFPVIANGKNSCTIKAQSIPLVSGTIGLTVNAYDRIGTKNGVAPYGFDCYADGRLLYQIRYRRIQRSLSHRIGLYYDSDTSDLSSYTMFLFDRISGNGTVKPGKEGKIIDITIVCFDAANNSTTLAFQVRADRQPEDSPLPAANLSRGTSLEMASEDKKCSITFPRGSALYDETLKLEVEGQPRVRMPGITSLSAVYSFSPTNLCIDRAAELSIAYDGGDFRKVAVYRFSRNGRYFSCVGASYDAAKKAFRIPVMRMGKYFLARDDAPPRIRFRNGMKVNAGEKLRLYVGDAGAGIDLDTAQVKVDGRAVVWDYDPDRHCIEILRHNPVWSKGKHEIAATIADRAGNQSARETFIYSIR